MRNTLLYIVVPCYNEEEVMKITSQQLLDKINKISSESKILFVNDGSTDLTWSIILKLARQDKHFIGISQSRNRGHQSSLLARLMEVKDKADAIISIDCDWQDDLSAINEMIDRYHEGYDIVYGVRKNRPRYIISDRTYTVENNDKWLK